MLQEIQSIRNPLLRALVGASAVFSIVAGGATVAVAVTGAKAYRAVVFAAIGGAVVGAGAGLAIRVDPEDEEKVSVQVEAETVVWKDWRNFMVARKIKESDGITSFYLKPIDGAPLPSFQPGQFLTIKINIPGRAQSLIRTYSLSDFAQKPDLYRLSIKRELAPKDLDVPPGIASNFIHDHVQEGTLLPAKPPSGRFVLDAEHPLPAVLISNGVGITPMIAMVKACFTADLQRSIWFLHGARNSQEHAFREEIANLAQQYPKLHVYYCYSRPLDTDEGKYHSQGYVDQKFLEEVIIPQISAIHGTPDAEYFLCGSPAFMDSIRSGLKTLAVPDHRVNFESFMKTKPVQGDKTSDREPIEDTRVTEVVFSTSGKTLNWRPSDGTILDLAEAQGINHPYSCRAGICLTCMCPILEGSVEYEEPPTGTPDRGSVLPCVARPKTDRIVLDA